MAIAVKPFTGSTMTLEQLRIFVEVARQEHIRKASEALNLTQSAVSSAVKTLERRYGLTLFDRIGRSIVLNRAGARFLLEASKILTAAKAGEAVLTDLSNLKTGALNIMASRTVGAYWLPQRLVTFRKSYPGVKLHVEIGNSDEVAEAVRAGHADIGFVESPDNSAGLIEREVARDEMIVVVSPGHRWAIDQHTPGSLAETRWILREKGSGTRHVFHQLLEEKAVAFSSLEIHLELPDNEAILGALKWDEAATLISRSAASNALQHGDAVEAKFDPIVRSYYLLKSDQHYLSRAAEAFERLITIS